MTKYIVNYLSTLQELTRILQELDEDLNNFVSVVIAEIADDSAICSLSTWSLPKLLDCHLMERKELEPIYIDYPHDKIQELTPFLSRPIDADGKISEDDLEDAAYYHYDHIYRNERTYAQKAFKILEIFLTDCQSDTDVRKNTIKVINEYLNDTQRPTPENFTDNIHKDFEEWYRTQKKIYKQVNEMMK